MTKQATTFQNPLELVDRYLQAVRFWLPKSQRQEGVLAELGEDLRSQIEEKEAELSRPLDKNEVSAILKKCGPPIVVAGRLGPNRYLIGPTLFPTYAFVLKMVLLWILVPVFLFIIGPVYVVNSAGNWPAALAQTIGDLWSGLFIAAGIITLVFVLIERSPAQAAIACKWDPLSLPPVQKTERKPSLAQSLSQLIFAVLGLLWLLLLPHHPGLILGPAAAILKAGPVAHMMYGPILLLTVLTILKPAISLARPYWTWFLPAAELVQSALTLIVVHFILNAAGQMTRGDWHPFVVQATGLSGNYIQAAAIVNISILISFACAWFGTGIALIVQLWKMFTLLRNKKINRQPATLRA
ncbi:MAG TPA: hypothetical protein VMX38_14950 [Verrucomicrobiae bacterium]|jgi:hypothetical protein|nr:hypothetical protein [Verrucomicrobiae bacterium]